MRKQNKISMITVFLLLSLATISSASAANTYNINETSYNDYFDTTGYIYNPTVQAGDVMDCSGTLTNKDMYIDRPLNITSTDQTGILINSTITILTNGSGTNITNLKINNSDENGIGIFLYETENNTVEGNYIHCNGPNGYGIALTRSNHNTISDNTVVTTQRSDMERTHSAIVLGESNYNTIEDNYVACDGANCIYLSVYGSGIFESDGPSYYNEIINNTCIGVDTSWCYAIQLMGSYNTALNNTILSTTFPEKTSTYGIGAYRGISSEQDSEGGNNIIGNTISATYCCIYASSNCTVSDNIISNYIDESTPEYVNSGISAGSDCQLTNNTINMTRGYGIYLKGSNSTINGNNVTTTGTQESIYLYGGINNNTISGNTVTSNSMGIFLKKQSSSTHPNNNTITNNHITTTNIYAVDSSQGSYNTITANYLVSENEQGNNAVNPGTGDNVTNNYGPLTINSTDPANGATSVATDKIITITFSDDIKAGTDWIELVNSAREAIPFSMNITDNILTITPTSALPESRYKLMLHTGCVTDLAGNPLAGKSISFSVGTSPTITATSPTDGATNVKPNKTITVTFSEAIRRSGNFWVELVDSSGTAIDYTSYITSGNILVINPTNDLTANTTYKLKLHTGCVTDLAGNPLAGKSITFTVGS